MVDSEAELLNQPSADEQPDTHQQQLDPTQDAIYTFAESLRIKRFVYLPTIFPALASVEALLQGEPISPRLAFGTGLAFGLIAIGEVLNNIANQTKQKRLLEIAQGSPILRREVPSPKK